MLALAAWESRRSPPWRKLVEESAYRHATGTWVDDVVLIGINIYEGPDAERRSVRSDGR
jgi:hypothetical protein